ncbi:MlaD family protein [Mycolicibacterium pyrenivorans]|uniref:MlaD family protein n=1 Tax=Mycolicibacterium pyrenivorans TaxID=187102 RepID=UPI0021F38B6A|nr:MlaD family protein [Mycolicibacterium pyrenivorans]MCV7150137.1 MCE family protein [Mycolicibacterium pyrenivorans]
MKMARSPLMWGTVAFALLTIAALVAAFVYVSPPTQRYVTFYTDDAQSIRPGDDVRIAGVTVGKVKDLALEANQVRARLSVERDAFVGNQSQIEVRMLTVVGGYYVNIVSLGDTPLGDTPISVERTTMPYSLMRTLVDTTKVTENVNPKPFNESLDQLEQGLAGTNVETLGAIVDAGNKVMSTIDRQRGQVTAILKLSDEWIQSLNNFEGTLRVLVRRISILEATLNIYSAGFGAGIQGLNDLINSLTPALLFYRHHHEEIIERLRRSIVKATDWTNRQGAITRSLRLIRNKIQRVLDAQNAPPELLATDLCFPTPGSSC